MAPGNGKTSWGEKVGPRKKQRYGDWKKITRKVGWKQGGGASEKSRTKGKPEKRRSRERCGGSQRREVKEKP